jgi:hypothetical protein
MESPRPGLPEHWTETDAKMSSRRRMMSKVTEPAYDFELGVLLCFSLCVFLSVQLRFGACNAFQAAFADCVRSAIY